MNKQYKVGEKRRRINSRRLDMEKSLSATQKSVLAKRNNTQCAAQSKKRWQRQQRHNQYNLAIRQE